MSPDRHAMRAPDAAWLRMDRPENPMVVTGLLAFAEPLDWDAFRARFEATIVERFDRFRQRPVEHADPRAPEWEDADDFDPALHFHHVALPAPGDDAALQAFIADRLPVPLDRARPLWDVYLLDGHRGGSAVLVRIHHCVADGIALGQVLLGMADGGAPSPNAGPPTGGRGLLGTLLGEGIETLRHPDHALALGAAAVRDARTLVKLLAPVGDPRTPIRDELTVAHRVAWSEPFDLWRVKHAAKALDATVNDVLVAAVTASIARYFAARAAPVEEVHALVPFNLRPPAEALDAELGNRFGLVLLALPTGIADGPARVREVARRMNAIKAGHEAPITLGILGLMGRLPSALEGRLIDFFSAKGSMVLTNVPGPRHPLTVCGRELSGVLVWAPCSGSVGMSVSVFSYAGKVTVGFLTAAGVVPEPQELADGCRAELLELARISRRTGRSRGRRSAPAPPRA